MQQGNINGFMGIAEDITERKKAEAALRESENKLTEALESEKARPRSQRFSYRDSQPPGFYEIAATEVAALAAL